MPLHPSFGRAWPPFKGIGGLILPEGQLGFTVNRSAFSATSTII